jgi:signal transduction histidine kinase
MSTEEMHNLFVVDYKKSKPGTNDEEGAGLSIVQRFCPKIRGKITVSSEPNQGSAFSFIASSQRIERSLMVQ